MSNTMCTVPWVGFSNDPDGRIRPCCISKDHVVKEDGTPYYTQKDNIKDIFHSKYMNELRQEFKDGKKNHQIVRYVGRMKKMVINPNEKAIMK